MLTFLSKSILGINIYDIRMAEYRVIILNENLNISFVTKASIKMLHCFRFVFSPNICSFIWFLCM